MRATKILLAILIGLTALLCTGCNEAQIGRAQSYADTAHTALDQATDHIGALEAQLAVAKKAAADSGDARIAAIVDQLQGAVAVARAALPGLRQASAQADVALASIRAQAAQGSVPWWQVLLGIAVPILLPLAKAIPVVGPLVGQIGEIAWAAYATHEQKAAQAATEARALALAQTVRGVEAAKAEMTPEQVQILHDELSKAQDQKAKDLVALVKAAA